MFSGVSLSEPHTSETALCVYVYPCLLAAAIYCKFEMSAYKLKY